MTRGDDPRFASDEPTDDVMPDKLIETDRNESAHGP
jgi:hypothetical protein